MANNGPMGPLISNDSVEMGRDGLVERANVHLKFNGATVLLSALLLDLIEKTSTSYSSKRHLASC